MLSLLENRAVGLATGACHPEHVAVAETRVIGRVNTSRLHLQSHLPVEDHVHIAEYIEQLRLRLCIVPFFLKHCRALLQVQRCSTRYARVLHVDTLPVLALRYLLKAQLLKHSLIKQVGQVYLLLIIFFNVRFCKWRLRSGVARVRCLALLEYGRLAIFLVRRCRLSLIDSMRL